MEVFPEFPDNSDDYGVIKTNVATSKFVQYDRGGGGQTDMEV